MNDVYKQARIGMGLPLRSVKEAVDRELEPLGITISIPTVYRFESGIRKNVSDAKYMLLVRYYEQIKRNWERKQKLDEIDRMGEENEYM